MTISLWHGARQWDGPPEIRPARAKRAEHGPGIYLTTRYETAQKYAKGGGKVMRVLVDEPLVMLSGARVPLAMMESFVLKTPRMKKRAIILADLRAHAARTKSEAAMPLSVLVNLMVNHDAAVGDVGVELARLLVSLGVDADVVTWADEDWLVLFNVAKIASVAPGKPASVAEYNLPLVRDRLRSR